MNTKEIIDQFEKAKQFPDNPPVRVVVRKADGEKETVNIKQMAEVVDGEGGELSGIYLIAEHKCETASVPAEPVRVYYWNGKLLKDMSPEDLQAVIILLLERQQPEPTAKPAEKK